MNQYVEKALLQLTGKSDIDYVSIQELERIVNDYPYFTVAQVLLAKKLKVAESEAFLPQAQKTALYFNNPYWLHFHLLQQLPVLHLEEDKTGEEELEEVEAEKSDPAPETSDFVVTETGNIRFSNEEIEAASLLAKQTLHDEPKEEATEVTNKEINDTRSAESSPSETSSSDIVETNTHSHASSDVEDDLQHKEAETGEEGGTAGDETDTASIINEDSVAETGAQQRTETYTSIAQTDHPAIPETYKKTEDPVTDPTLGVNIEETGETERSESPKETKEEMGLSIESNFYHPDDFSQQPSAPKDVHSLDHPLIVEDVVQSAETSEETPEQQEEKSEYVLSNLSEKISELDNPVEDIEKIDLGDPLASPTENINIAEPEETGGYVLSNLSEKIADLDEPVENIDLGAPAHVEEEAEEQPAPDPFHPEAEEILEEMAQQEADKEESNPSAPQGSAVETVPENIEPKETAISTTEEDTPSVPSISTTKESSLSETAPANEPLIPIEPYYTVDYFASQGIKLSIEKDPQDKLGKQLRRFTDWLKHMKRIGPEDASQLTAIKGLCFRGDKL